MSCQFYLPFHLLFISVAPIHYFSIFPLSRCQSLFKVFLPQVFPSSMLLLKDLCETYLRLCYSSLLWDSPFPTRFLSTEHQDHLRPGPKLFLQNHLLDFHKILLTFWSWRKLAQLHASLPLPLLYLLAGMQFFSFSAWQTCNCPLK